jgi:hypothetical protein
MRVGITYQNRQILPRVDELHLLLPLQVLLPTVFKIRAKSITEGEVCALFFVLTWGRLFDFVSAAEPHEDGYKKFAHVNE